MPHAAKIATHKVESILCFLKCWQKNLQRITKSDNEDDLSTTYICSYIQRSLESEATCLIELAQMYSYVSEHKKVKWLKGKKVIVSVYPQLKEPPNENSSIIQTYMKILLLEETSIIQAL